MAERQSQNRAAAEPSNNDLAFTQLWTEVGSRSLTLMSEPLAATVNKFATLFGSRVNTITTHGGRQGHHPAQARRIFDREMVKEGWDDAKYNALRPDVKKVFNNMAVIMARQEYLACLFVRQANAGRYSEL